LAMPSRAIIKGDATVQCISAASILAKVHRDAEAYDLDLRYPGYGFAKHKGYGTALHMAALKELGPIPEHRVSFAPVRAAYAQRKLF
jgi:ribonuclease HII